MIGTEIRLLTMNDSSEISNICGCSKCFSAGFCGPSPPTLRHAENVTLGAHAHEKIIFRDI
jgi:hypothetical protein